MEENNIHKLDAIKEIIFGENIKEYDKEFKKLKDQISKQKEEFHLMAKTMKKELQDLMKETDRVSKTQIEDLRKEMIAKIGQLETSKTSKELLADMLIEVGKNLKK